MGNALETFSDISEEGNTWEARLAASAAPSAEDVLGRGSWQFPQLVVAPSWKPQGGLRQVHDPSAADQPHQQQPPSPAAAPTSPASAREDVFHRPAQVVLRAGTRAEDSRYRGAGTQQQQAAWVPLEKCAGLRGRTLLTQERLAGLHPHLPVATRFATCWKMIYCPRVHGVSLQTFYRQCQAWPGETLLLVEDAEGVVFGGFASHTWVAHRKLHFGTPESFVFTFGGAAAELEPEPPEPVDEAAAGSEAEQPPSAPEPRIYPWAGGNHNFMFAGAHGFGMGGGRGYAFWIDRDLLVGSSVASETFGNLGPLGSGEEFVVRSLECWAFDHHMLAGCPEQSSGPVDSRAASPEAQEVDSPKCSPARRRLRQRASDALRFEAFA